MKQDKRNKIIYFFYYYSFIYYYIIIIYSFEKDFKHSSSKKLFLMYKNILIKRVRNISINKE